MSANPIDIYGAENVRIFGDMAERLEKIFLQKSLEADFDLSHLEVSQFDHEPWHRYIESLGCRMIGEDEAKGEIYRVCRWNGVVATPADKDNYDSFLVINPNIGDPAILVPKDIAIKILTLGVP